MRLYDIKSRFTTEEFQCGCGCDFGTKEEHIEPELIERLNVMRVIYGKPMVVTSGARCAEHNDAVDGVEDSAHLPHPDTGQCRAVDILVTHSGDRYNLIRHALAVGIERIGLGPNFLHFDMAWDLPAPIVFNY